MDGKALFWYHIFGKKQRNSRCSENSHPIQSLPFLSSSISNLYITTNQYNRGGLLACIDVALPSSLTCPRTWIRGDDSPRLFFRVSSFLARNHLALKSKSRNHNDGEAFWQPQVPWWSFGTFAHVSIIMVSVSSSRRCLRRNSTWLTVAAEVGGLPTHCYGSLRFYLEF